MKQYVIVDNNTDEVIGTFGSGVESYKPGNYTVGKKVTSSTDSGGLEFYYRATTRGNTGKIEPVWPIGVGETIKDGAIVWECHLYTPKTGTRLEFTSPDEFGTIGNLRHVNAGGIKFKHINGVLTPQTDPRPVVTVKLDSIEIDSGSALTGAFTTNESSFNGNQLIILKSPDGRRKLKINITNGKKKINKIFNVAGQYRFESNNKYLISGDVIFEVVEDF